ncbi:E3 ubiquitin-protein ligase TRIM21-like isoform X3 [Thunnus thynnus]|uniref:E3 ubiquitin-protein ligase TRIM21-like isoform X3 n=1 Tax=Thunnus thynnus TaxID=8237 RepID=UPI003529AA75
MTDRSHTGSSRIQTEVLNTSDMSKQVCHCGWSKETTYQGLRTHQGKKGCTPKGMHIPQCDQFMFNSYKPTITYMMPPIKIEDPFLDAYTSIKTDTTDMPAEMLFPSLRIHQSMMGSTPRGIRIQESEPYIYKNQLQESHQKDSKPNTSALVKKENVPAPPDLTTETNPAATEAAMEMIKSLLEYQQRSLQMAQNSDNTHRELDFSTGAQHVLMPVSQNLSFQMNPAAAEATVKETSKSFFESPQRSHQSATSSDKACRALDFSTGVQQVQNNLFEHPDVEQNRFYPMDQLMWGPPTTTAQGTAVRPQVEEKEKEKEKEREAQKLLKARQDRTRADLQQKTQMREQKVAEVRSSLKACKGSLDAEWLEINSVFSEVMRVVEDTRQKALQPLEERRQRVKKEAQQLVQKLQREIDELKRTIDELDKNPDLQVSALTSLDESRDWKHLTVDTSFSFGTLRATTSVMMEQIHQKLEKLSSVELKRIPAFAVDVKLDPTSAHQCLVLSPDGKRVRDGGKNQPAPDSPKRFDLYGSILGLNRLTTGKSYWEVEVSNKTGWDLGVARGDANRKGELSLNPDNGYWALVHYEGKKYAALTAPPVPLTLKEKPRKVGVFVAYEEGLVSFYDVTAQSHIYSFTNCSFRDEILPYFSPHLKQNDENVDPLIISAV